MVVATEINHEYNSYIGKSADFIKVLWELHKDRLSAGSVSFAVDYQNEPAPFDLSKRVADFRNGGSTYPRNVVREYNQGVFLSIRSTLDLFRRSLYQKYDPKRVTEDGIVENISPLYLDPKIYDLYLDISIGSVIKSRNTAIQDPTEGRVIEAGLRTGVDIPVQMRAVMGEDFQPKDAVAVSKIDLSFLQPAKTMTGMRSFLSMREPSFALFHPDARINDELLRLMGRGSAVGCPASRIAGPEIRNYFDKAGKDGSSIMLAEFCSLLSLDYAESVEKWYRQLSLRDRELFVDEEAELLLSGEVWDVIKARGKGPFV